MEHDDREREIVERLSSLGIDEGTRNALMVTASAEPGRLDALDAATRLASRLSARGAVDDPEEAAALIRGLLECELAARRTMPNGIDRGEVQKLVAAATEYPPAPERERPTADHHALWITVGGLVLGALGVMLQIV